MMWWDLGQEGKRRCLFYRIRDEMAKWHSPGCEALAKLLLHTRYGQHYTVATSGRVPKGT